MGYRVLFNSTRFWLKLFCGLLLVLATSLWLTPAVAASPNDSRIAQLEVQVRTLQSEIRTLQNQSPAPNLSDRPHSGGVGPVEQTPVPGDLSFEAQFDNLATLVIELNQRVIAIENQLSE